MKNLGKLMTLMAISFSLTACVITAPIEIAAEIVEGAVDITTGVVGGAVDITTGVVAGTVDLVTPDNTDCDSTNEDEDDDCPVKVRN